MTIDVKKLDKKGLQNLIDNHREEEDRFPLYLDALLELEKRTGKGLDFDKSLAIISSAAKERRFLSYKDLADASGADWSKVHYAIGAHLWRLVEYGNRRGWPMLSAIVVNKQNLDTGQMEDDTIKGFIAAARDLNLPVTDEQTFLSEQQEKVFLWAASQK